MNDAILKTRCSESTARAFKVLAAELGATQGQLLRTIAFMVKTRQLTHGQLAQAHIAASSIPESGFVGDDVPGHRQYLDRVRHMALDAGDMATAAHFETKAAQLDEIHEISGQPLLAMHPATFEMQEATSDPNEKLQAEA